ncbi:MAG: hypothetical protein ACXADY_23150 [Candidatus Hodarchaeales archaeon]
MATSYYTRREMVPLDFGIVTKGGEVNATKLINTVDERRGSDILKLQHLLRTYRDVINKDGRKKEIQVWYRQSDCGSSSIIAVEEGEKLVLDRELYNRYQARIRALHNVDYRSSSCPVSHHAPNSRLWNKRLASFVLKSTGNCGFGVAAFISSNHTRPLYSSGRGLIKKHKEAMIAWHNFMIGVAVVKKSWSHLLYTTATDQKWEPWTIKKMGWKEVDGFWNPNSGNSCKILTYPTVFQRKDNPNLDGPSHNWNIKFNKVFCEKYACGEQYL